MTRRYSLEIMLLDDGVVAYRCTDVAHRRQVLSGAESSTEEVLTTARRQLDHVRRGCRGTWEVEIELQPAVPL